MSKLIMGQSTSDEFLNAINEKGASLTEKSTADELASALDSTGANVSFLSPSEYILKQINETSPGPEPVISIIPWSASTVSDKMVFYKDVVGDILNPDNYTEEYEYIFHLKIYTGDSGTDSIEVGQSVMSISCDGHLESIEFIINDFMGVSLYVNYTNNFEDTASAHVHNDRLKLTTGNYTVDGVTTELTEDINTVELPHVVWFEDGDTGEDSPEFNYMLKFVNTISVE